MTEAAQQQNPAGLSNRWVQSTDVSGPELVQKVLNCPSSREFELKPLLDRVDVSSFWPQRKRTIQILANSRELWWYGDPLVLRALRETTKEAQSFRDVPVYSSIPVNWKRLTAELQPGSVLSLKRSTNMSSVPRRHLGQTRGNSMRGQRFSFSYFSLWEKRRNVENNDEI